jgi:hypothetical protein
MARLSLLAVILALAAIGGANDAAAQAQQPTATLTVHFRICDEIPAGGDYYSTCHDNGSGAGVYLEVSNADIGGVAASGTTGADGNITFALFAGSYSVGGPPGDFLDASAIFCSQNSSPSVAIAYPVNLGTGGAVTCDFYVVPTCNDPDGDCTPDSTPPPTTDDDDSGTGQVTTLPSTGSGATADAASSDWQTPLAALAAALALGAALTIQPARRRS